MYRRENAVESELLFGLVALQLELIDQEQLIRGFRAWGEEKSRRLMDFLVEAGGIDEDQGRGLEGMVASHLKRHGGDVEKSLGALALDSSTRAKLTALKDGGLDATLSYVGQASTQPAASRTEAHAIGAATVEGRRFRVLRPHARGGLGAVFIALDEELHREVALKQILDDRADDPVSRERFVLEAEITGVLEHPGIIPVYGLGHHTDGRPYYAMRFIKGDSLKEAIAEFHRDDSLKANDGTRVLAIQRLLRRFLDVCNAIEYAHGRGVLHRDLKPANIIVGRHGETLVLDWGLAKVVAGRTTGQDVEAPIRVSGSGGGSSNTLPGSALGTPAPSRRRVISTRSGRGVTFTRWARRCIAC
jgi:serine/threonine-protein kinase